MPKDNYKVADEKKLNKVAIYLNDLEKEELMKAIGDRKMSVVLRSLVFEFVRKHKMSQR
jgi:hypothetical protein